jgi:hypothetical protein
MRIRHGEALLIVGVIAPSSGGTFSVRLDDGQWTSFKRIFGWNLIELYRHEIITWNLVDQKERTVHIYFKADDGSIFERRVILKKAGSNNGDEDEPPVEDREESSTGTPLLIAGVALAVIGGMALVASIIILTRRRTKDTTSTGLIDSE